MTAPLQSLFCRRKREVKRNLDLAARYDARADACEANGFKKQAESWRYNAAMRRVQAAKEQLLIEAMQEAQAPTAFEQEDLHVEVTAVVNPAPMHRKRCKRTASDVKQMALALEGIAA